MIAEYTGGTARWADPTSRRQVLLIRHRSSFHFGGWMGFGPDGFLYVTTGDTARPELGLSRDPDSPHGKLLRLDPADPDGPEGPATYSVPADNPNVGGPGHALVWASGLRNAWRAGLDDLTGDLWLTDVGQSRFEEVHRLDAGDLGRGLDFGWPACEGDHAYVPGSETVEECAEPGVTGPLLEYEHVAGRCAITGGTVYRGSAQPSLYGRYLFGDYCTGEIWSIPAGFQSGDPLPPPLDTGLLLTSFGEDGLGELYAVSQRGKIVHVLEAP